MSVGSKARPRLALLVRKAAFDRNLGHVSGFLSAFAGDVPLFANQTFSLSHAVRRLVPTLDRDHIAATEEEALFTCHCGDTACNSEDLKVRHLPAGNVALEHVGGRPGSSAKASALEIPADSWAQEVLRIARDALWAHRTAAEPGLTGPTSLAALVAWGRAARGPAASADLGGIAATLEPVADRFPAIDDRPAGSDEERLLRAPDDLLVGALGDPRFRAWIGEALGSERLVVRFRALEMVHAGRMTVHLPRAIRLRSDRHFVLRQALADLLVDLPRDGLQEELAAWASEEKDAPLARFIGKYLVADPARPRARA